MSLSKISFFLCTIMLCYTSFFFHPAWKQAGTEATISWDVSGYYWYLPSIFIYKDLKVQSFKDSILAKYGPTGQDFQQGFKYKNGNYVMKYSCGMAILYSPFFAIGHFAAKFLGYKADGFSAPYQLSLQAGSLLFGLLGLWYFRKLFLRYYSERIVAICLALVVFGTNYLNYVGVGGGMSHGWLFTIYVFLLLTCYEFYRKPSYKYAAVIGLLIGISILVRPTEIISCIIPLAWGMESLSKTSFDKQINFLKKNIRYLVLAVVLTAVISSIQSFYWMYAGGDWFIYSYQDQGFDWLKPHIKDYLISTHNGWWAYTPLMAFSLIGLPAYLKNGSNKIAFLLFSIVNLYLVCAWECYWYGGRFMIQSYPILFFIIASFIQAASYMKIGKWIWSILIAGCVYINLWTTYHAHAGPGLLDFETMNDAFYFRVIGTWKRPSDATIKLKDTNEAYDGDEQNMRMIFFTDFEKDTMNTICSLSPIEGKRSACVSPAHRSVNTFLPANSEMNKWIRAEATFHCPWKEWSVWNMAEFIVEFKKDGNKVKSNMIRIHRFLNDGETKTIFLDSKIPEEEFDTVMIALYSASSMQTLQMDNLKVYSLKRRE